MATRAFVGIKEDGKYTIIYNHSDGYPEWLGELLYEHFRSVNDVRKLIKLGYISFMCEQDFYDKNYEYYKNETNWNDICGLKVRSSYYEPEVPDVVENFEEYIKNSPTIGHVYIFDTEDNTWYYYNHYDEQKFVPLVDVLSKNRR